jgi:AcrR family transcriptional regulator
VTAPTAREPRQDRSRATRERLLQTAVDCLAELGWAGTTMTVVAERAGVSRGSAQYHFRTREELVTAAVEHLSEVRLTQMRREAARLPAGEAHTEAVLRILVRLYTGPLFRAALQLWVAASADAALRARVQPLEVHLGREAHRIAVELLGADERLPGVRETVQGTLDMLRGLGLAALLADDGARRARLLRQWARTLDAVLPAGEPG